MTSSSGTNSLGSSAARAHEARHVGGTLTRAKCSLPVSGLRTRTARLSESPEM